MTFLKTIVSEDVRKYCAQIGVDPLLVQGAGGNISWKEGSVLWVKASGAWLANAENENIFIPVNLDALKLECIKQNFKAVPEVVENTKSRPSIETMLHALMPQPVVLHLHAIEILAYLVRQDFMSYFHKTFTKIFRFAVVDYFKPGADLASAVSSVLSKDPSVQVIFLKNHGVVIGGENITVVHKILTTITELLVTIPISKNYSVSPPPSLSQNLLEQYSLIVDAGVQQLALNQVHFRRLSYSWVLYPDHVVFLGPRVHTYTSLLELTDEISNTGIFPELIFLNGQGVFAKQSFTKAKQVQLRCYFDIMDRQNHEDLLVVLTDNQIAELINWDAEKYRISFTV